VQRPHAGASAHGEDRPPGAAAGLGRLLLDLPEHRAEAEIAFRRAIELDPKDAQPWNSLGILLEGLLGRHAEAEAAYLSQGHRDRSYVCMVME
jgi:Flp pilus assembly protein TadD